MSQQDNPTSSFNPGWIIVALLVVIAGVLIFQILPEPSDPLAESQALYDQAVQNRKAVDCLMGTSAENSYLC